MIKKLKTIEQLKKEFMVKKYSYGNSIDFKNVDGGFEGKILKGMFKYFGKSIEVEKYDDKKNGLRNYDWVIIDHDVKYYFQDNWFENDDYKLEDSLFEI